MGNLRLLGIGLLFIPFTSLSQLIEERPINMGTIVVVDNSTVQSLTVDLFGNVIASTGLRIIERGEPGSYVATSLIPNVTYNISVSVQNSTMNPGVASQEYFTFDIPSYDEQVLSDNNGDATIRVGGRIRTSGSGGQGFTDASYVSTVRVTISF